MRERRLKRRRRRSRWAADARARGRRREQRWRPRADRRTARPSRGAAEARSPGAQAPGRAGWDGLRATHEKISTEPPIAPAVPTRRASCRVPAGAFEATTLAARDDATIGAMSCDPQRGCSFGARSPPFSYVPIEMCSAPWYAARSGPRSARAAGRNATPAAAISLVPAERRDRRSARAATAVPRIAASTLGRSNGKRACGIARRTIGSNANASARTIGPRSTGMRLRAAGARCGFRPAAMCSTPSSPRTAQPHDVGPCTSTPFWRAIPPSRTVSSAILRP